MWLGVLRFFNTGQLDANIENVTISGNEALSRVGGVWVGLVDQGGTGGSIDADFKHVTMTLNKSLEGGGLFREIDSLFSTTLTNTIVSGNVVSANDSTESNVAGVIEAASSFNLFGTTVPANLTGLGNIPAPNNNPLLHPLFNNGGRTQTHRPMLTSPVVDAGDPSFTSPPDFDQRGTSFSRIFDVPGVGTGGSFVDIGAYEINPPKIIDVAIRKNHRCCYPWSKHAGRR